MDKNEADAILHQHHYPPNQLIRQKTSRYPLWYANTSNGQIALKIHPEALRIAKLMHHLGDIASPLPFIYEKNYMLIPWLSPQPNSILTYQQMIPIIQKIADCTPPLSLTAQATTPVLPALKDHAQKATYYEYLRHQLKHPPLTWQNTKIFSHHDIHPDNIVMYQDKIHLLDWEFACYQDPAYIYMETCLSLTYNTAKATLITWAEHWESTPIDWPYEHTVYAFYSVLYHWLYWDHCYGSTKTVFQCIKNILNDPQRHILFPKRQ